MTDIQQDGRARRQQDIFDLNRTKLIDTAVDVINEVGDIREVTLTQIAKEAGVSPATAYNHFPDRMEDVFSAIVHSRMDVAANMGATLADDSLTVIEKLKKIPVTYAENLVSLGYAGKVVVVQMFNLVNVNKWLDQDPVQAITALLSNFKFILKPGFDSSPTAFNDITGICSSFKSFSAFLRNAI